MYSRRISGEARGRNDLAAEWTSRWIIRDLDAFSVAAKEKARHFAGKCSSANIAPHSTASHGYSNGTTSGVASSKQRTASERSAARPGRVRVFKSRRRLRNSHKK